MDTMKDTTMQHVTDVTIVPEATAEFIAGLLERIEQLESDLATAEQDSRQKQARIERLEEEESKQAALLDCLNEWKALAKSAEKERDVLRAKIEAMEKQEPAGYGVRYVEPANGEEDWDSIWMHRVFAEDHIKDFTQAYVDIGEPVGAITVVPLYALPGAKGE